MNGFTTCITRISRADILLAFTLLSGFWLLAVSAAQAQPYVWDAGYFGASDWRANFVSESKIHAFTPGSGWHDENLHDNAAFAWSDDGDTLSITSRTYAGAYAVHDPTTAEAAMRVVVTGFGTPKLSIDWRISALAFDNPGSNPARTDSAEQSTARLGVRISLPFFIRMAGTMQSVGNVDSFDLSYDWGQRFFLTLSDSDVANGAAAAMSEIYLNKASAKTSLLEPDGLLFRGQTISSAAMRREGLDSKTIDFNRQGFGSAVSEGDKVWVIQELFAQGLFVRGGSVAKELHAQGYIEGHLDMYIDGQSGPGNGGNANGNGNAGSNGGTSGVRGFGGGLSAEFSLD